MFNATPKYIQKFEHTQQALGMAIDPFLAGTIFAQPAPYTTKEKQRILMYLLDIVNKKSSDVLPTNTPCYHGTAGAPGAGKSYYLESITGKNPKDAMYIDPDRVALPNLTLYQADFVQDSGQAYTKWRNASNFIANFMLVMAVAENKNIVHGTTATGPRMIQIYNTLKERGYNIQVDVLFAASDQRKRALEHRFATQGIVQHAEADIDGKFSLLYQRLYDAYLLYANELNLFLQPSHFWEGASPQKFVTLHPQTGEVSVCPEYEKFRDQLQPLLQHDLQDQLKQK